MKLTKLKQYRNELANSSPHLAQAILRAISEISQNRSKNFGGSLYTSDSFLNNEEHQIVIEHLIGEIEFRPEDKEETPLTFFSIEKNLSPLQQKSQPLSPRENEIFNEIFALNKRLAKHWISIPRDEDFLQTAEAFVRAGTAILFPAKILFNSAVDDVEICFKRARKRRALDSNVMKAVAEAEKELWPCLLLPLQSKFELALKSFLLKKGHIQVAIYNLRNAPTSYPNEITWRIRRMMTFKEVGLPHINGPLLPLPPREKLDRIDQDILCIIEFLKLRREWTNLFSELYIQLAQKIQTWHSCGSEMDKSKNKMFSRAMMQTIVSFNTFLEKTGFSMLHQAVLIQFQSVISPIIPSDDNPLYELYQALQLPPEVKPSPFDVPALAAAASFPSSEIKGSLGAEPISIPAAHAQPTADQKKERPTPAAAGPVSPARDASPPPVGDHRNPKSGPRLLRTSHSSLSPPAASSPINLQR